MQKSPLQKSRHLSYLLVNGSNEPEKTEILGVRK
jgi:hypothetical protein